eukprot:g6418.t1
MRTHVLLLFAALFMAQAVHVAGNSDSDSDFSPSSGGHGSDNSDSYEICRSDPEESSGYQTPENVNDNDNDNNNDNDNDNDNDNNQENANCDSWNSDDVDEHHRQNDYELQEAAYEAEEMRHERELAERSRLRYEAIKAREKGGNKAKSNTKKSKTKQTKKATYRKRTSRGGERGTAPAAVRVPRLRPGRAQQSRTSRGKFAKATPSSSRPQSNHGSWGQSSNNNSKKSKKRKEQEQSKPKESKQPLARKARARKAGTTRAPFDPSDVCFDDESGTEHMLSPIVPHGWRATSKAGAQLYNNEMMSSATPKAPGGGRAPRDRSANPCYAGYNRDVVMGMPVCRHVLRHRYLNIPDVKIQVPKQNGKSGVRKNNFGYITNLDGVRRFIRFCVQELGIDTDALYAEPGTGGFDNLLSVFSVDNVKKFIRFLGTRGFRQTTLRNYTYSLKKFVADLLEFCIDGLGEDLGVEITGRQQRHLENTILLLGRDGDARKPVAKREILASWAVDKVIEEIGLRDGDGELRELEPEDMSQLYEKSLSLLVKKLNTISKKCKKRGLASARHSLIMDAVSLAHVCLELEMCGARGTILSLAARRWIKFEKSGQERICTIYPTTADMLIKCNWRGGKLLINTKLGECLLRLQELTSERDPKDPDDLAVLKDLDFPIFFNCREPAHTSRRNKVINKKLSKSAARKQVRKAYGSAEHRNAVPGSFGSVAIARVMKMIDSPWTMTHYQCRKFCCWMHYKLWHHQDKHKYGITNFPNEYIGIKDYEQHLEMKAKRMNNEPKECYESYEKWHQPQHELAATIASRVSGGKDMDVGDLDDEQPD